jgi:hypothetical protein
LFFLTSQKKKKTKDLNLWFVSLTAPVIEFLTSNLSIFVILFELRASQIHCFLHIHKHNEVIYTHNLIDWSCIFLLLLTGLSFSFMLNFALISMALCTRWFNLGVTIHVFLLKTIRVCVSDSDCVGQP